MIKQLLTAATLIASTATASQAMVQAGFDFYFAQDANGCGNNVSVLYRDNVGDVAIKVKVNCGQFSGDDGHYDRESRSLFWVRCKATGNDLIADRRADGSSSEWRQTNPDRMSSSYADAACGRIGSPDLRSVN